MATDPARVVAAVRRAKQRNEVRKSISPAVMQYQEMVYGHNVGPALPRDPLQFLAGTFTPLTPIQPVPVNVPDWDDSDEDNTRPGPRQREMPVGWNMPTGVPGSEGFKLASFGTLRMYADIYSVARSCIQLRKNEIRGLEWDVMPTPEAERKMRGDVAAHRDFAERRAKVVKFFRKPDPDYLSFGSYVDAVVEEMLVTDALSLYIHPTRKKSAGPFGSDVAALEIISGNTIRPLVNTRGGRVRPPSPGYQQYLYGVPRVDLMEILQGTDEEAIKELGKPVKEYRGDQLMYLPYTQRAWTPYGFPPLERTLIPTITGLRKQQFQMDFFDEGTIPGNYISPGENIGWTPNQLQIWQNQQNALAGDPAWKHKSVALPPGSKVFPMKPIEIADQSDEVIMTQVCMGYDVEPMELGVSPKVSATQSTGAAHQMAKASQDKQQRKSTKPTLAFLTDIFNVLIQVVWGQEDMRFFFEGLEEDEDEDSLINRLVQMIGIGLSSIDEARIALGKSPWGLPITSDPVFSSPTAGLVPLGSIDPTTGKPMGTPPPAPVGAPPGPGGGPPPGVGGAPDGPPKALPPGAGQQPGQPAAGSPGAAPQAQGPDQRGRMPEPLKLGEDGQPIKPGQPGYDSQHPAPPPKLHPDDKVGQARQDAQEAHAGVQAQMHQDFAAGKPLEPPVRPPVQSEDTVPVKGKSTKAMLSELDALRRKTKAAGRPLDWDCKHLDIYYVAHFYDLCKILSPDDAHRVVRQELIAAFGPPTVQAALDEFYETRKTFGLGTPVDSTDGKQGLAPMEYQGEKPVEQSYPCKECGVSAGRHLGSCSRFDNGASATAPGQNESVVLPKALGMVTTAWAGWRYDKQLAARYAIELRQALHDAVDAEAIARDYLATKAVTKHAPYRYRHGWIKLDPDEISGDDVWNSDEGRADLSEDAVSKIRGGWFGRSFLKTQDIAASPKKYNTPLTRKNASWEAAHAMQDNMKLSTKAMVLHRGVNDGSYTFGPVGSKVGKTYKGRGFTATTSDDSGKMTGQYSGDEASYPDGKAFYTKTIVHIHAPAGTPMLKGDERLTPIPDELKEHVLPIGTKFKVLSDTVSTDPADIAAHNQHVTQGYTNAIRHVEVQVVQ